MGQAFAERLIGAGFAVLGFDRDPTKEAWLASRGGRAARCIGELAREASPIVIAVFSTDQVEEVVQGLMPALAPDARRFVLCASTCDPDRIASLGGRCASHGLRFLEVPVSGTSEQVRRHEGVALIGGEEALIAEDLVAEKADGRLRLDHEVQGKPSPAEVSELLIASAQPPHPTSIP